MASNDSSVRKHVQIAKTNKMMFLWIAIASIVIGSAIVVSIFLTQRLLYNEEVLAKKGETVKTIEDNLEEVDALKEEILKLDANSALLSARASDDEQAIQVILDALPSEANSLALGASLQSRLLAGIDGLTLESLRVDSIEGVETGTTGAEYGAVGDDGFYEITFSFTVTGSQEALEQVLLNLESSIRTIDVTSLRIEGQSGSSQEMVVTGRAFYEPALEITFSKERI